MTAGHSGGAAHAPPHPPSQFGGGENSLFPSRLLSACTALLDLLLPPHCPCCLGAVTTHRSVCASCFGRLGFITEPLCTGCGLPFASAGLAGPLRLCGVCLADPPPWRAARAALLYNDAAKALILPMKHADRQENAAVLAAHMGRAGALLLQDADLLVPVPLHRRRLRARGFNQAALLAQALGRRNGRTCVPDLLRRTRHTPSLGAHAAAKRAEIMDHVINVRPSRAALLTSKTVLLVDDVMTSGATAAACARALLDAGAARIDVLVAARVADPRLG